MSEKTPKVTATHDKMGAEHLNSEMVRSRQEGNGGPDTSTPDVLSHKSCYQLKGARALGNKWLVPARKRSGRRWQEMARNCHSQMRTVSWEVTFRGHSAQHRPCLARKLPSDTVKKSTTMGESAALGWALLPWFCIPGLFSLDLYTREGSTIVSLSGATPGLNPAVGSEVLDLSSLGLQRACHTAGFHVLRGKLWWLN